MPETASHMSRESAASGVRVQLDVSGMTCAGCAARVEKRLGRVAGVEVASVDLALERAEVRYRDRVPMRDLIAAVEKAGYKARERARDAAGRRAERRHGETEARRREQRTLKVFLASALFTLPLVAQMGTMAAGTAFYLPPMLELLLAAPVQIVAGARFYRGAYNALRSGIANMDVLVALGTSVAFFYSLVRVLLDGAAAAGHLYFEVSAIILTLMVFAKLLEARARRSSTAAVRGLMALRPGRANRLTENGVETVKISQLRLGDWILVKPGQPVAVDGMVREGASTLDESLITGEGTPVPRGPGDTVTAGTINGPGALSVEATALGEDTALARIIHLVENAYTGKAPVQRLANRAAAIFVPLAIGLSTLTFFAWWLIGGEVEAAIVAAVSVMVIACPCALGLATPPALVAAAGAAVRSGILVRDIAALEAAVHVNTVVFAKTGMLTEGRPEVTDIRAFDGNADRLLRIAASAQTASEHPLAQAMVRAAQGRGLPLTRPTKVSARIGRGLIAEIAGQPVSIGNSALMDEFGIDRFTADSIRREWEAQAKTSVMVAVAGRCVGVIAMADRPRAQAADGIAALKRMGMRTLMLTGDTPAAARALADQIGLDEVEAAVPPHGKAACIEKLRGEGAVVAMVADGLNDAPALAAADIGIAMGSRSNSALEAADIMLMHSDPRLVAASLEISRATVRKIRQNLFWAVIYNVVAIPLAAAGLLSPVLAAMAMVIGSISVMTNTGLLCRWRAKV